MNASRIASWSIVVLTSSWWGIAALAAEVHCDVETSLGLAVEQVALRRSQDALQVLNEAWKNCDANVDRGRILLTYAGLFNKTDCPLNCEQISIDLDLMPAQELCDAEALYEIAIGLLAEDNINRIIAVNNLAVLWINSQQYERAARLLETNLSDIPLSGKAKFFYNYGLALEGLGRNADAFSSYVCAARNQPDFPESFMAAIRLSDQSPLPDSAPLALELVQIARRAGEPERVKALLESFLRHSSWIDQQIYEENFPEELLLILGSNRLTDTQIHDTWLEFISDLIDHVPETVRYKLEAITGAIRSGAKNLSENNGWRTSLEARRQFSKFLKQLGDRYLHQEQWEEAFDNYYAALEIDPENIDAAAYLFNVLSIGPSSLDPEGQIARETVTRLQELSFTESSLERAGIFSLASEAFNRRGLYKDATDAIQIAFDINVYPPGKEIELAVEEPDPAYNPLIASGLEVAYVMGSSSPLVWTQAHSQDYPLGGFPCCHPAIPGDPQSLFLLNHHPSFFKSADDTGQAETSFRFPISDWSQANSQSYVIGGFPSSLGNRNSIKFIAMKVQADGELVYINAGSQDGVSEGARLDIFEGAHSDEKVGDVRVELVGKDFSFGIITEGGDKVGLGNVVLFDLF